MLFPLKDTELKEESDKIKSEIQNDSFSQIDFNKPTSKEKRAIINRRYYLKHKNKEQQKKEQENHNYPNYPKELFLSTNPLMNEEQFKLMNSNNTI